MTDVAIDPNELKKVLNKAKIGMMSQHNSTFITTILFSLKFSWDKSIPTAATNGIDLKINDEWFYALDPKERIGLLAHEAWHVAFNHVTRGMAKQAKRYNEAADYVINNMLVADGFILPKGGLVDRKYDKHSTEDVYNKLPDDPDDTGPGGGLGNDIQTPKTKQAAKDIAAAVTNTIVKAATQAKMSGEGVGNIPGEIQVLIEELTNPKLDWKTIFHNYMNGFAKNDYSYRRPNRRFLPDFILPGLYSENVEDLAFAYDTSCSVTDNEFAAYFGETKAMRELLNPVMTTIVSFDTQVQNIHHIAQDDSMDSVTFTGRGGTNLYPVFDYYKKHRPTVLVVFSDLQCQPIDVDPGFPVVWICVNSPQSKVNFGTLIHYETDRN